MCGRYSLTLSDSKKGKQIRQRAEKLSLIYKEGDIFPGDQVLCMIPAGSKIDLAVMKWGIASRSFLINARYETLQDRPTFRDMKEKRCAVVSNGFYEWDKDKKKYYVHTDEEFLYLACIFNERNELLILTEAADEDFAKVHDRSPIVMDQSEMLRFIHNEPGTIAKKDLVFETEEDELKLF